MTDLTKLNKYKKIVIQCHDNPDADALACAYALSEYLKQSGRETAIVYGGFAPVNKSSLKLMMTEFGIDAQYLDKKCPPPDYSAENGTLLLVVDGQYGAGNVKKLCAAAVGVLDHHTPETSPVELSDIRPFLGSCSTLVWLLLKNSGFDFERNNRVSTALYYGLYTDTGSLAEITHPLDRDMRDNLCFDKALIKKLKNCNLSMNDLSLAGKCLAGGRVQSVAKSAVFSAEPCDPNILGFISDLALQVDGIDTCVVFCEVSGGVKLSVRSCVKEVMAFELAAWLCQGGGSGGGHADKAGGFISADFIGKNGHPAGEFILSRYNEYFTKYDLIYAGKYKPVLADFRQFVKLNIPVGYVRTTDIFQEGTEILIRTLEGDTHVKSDKDIYVMVGIRQEVYPIRREKFERTYEALNGKYIPLTEFFLENHYAPSVKSLREGVSENIEKYIRPCVSKGETRIYAKQLDKCVKVFTVWNNEGYLSGKPGDWLVMRSDDLSDVYIVENKIFELTYCEISKREQK